MTQVLEDLIEARRLVEKGWVRFSLKQKKKVLRFLPVGNQYCAMGALFEATEAQTGWHFDEYEPKTLRMQKAETALRKAVPTNSYGYHAGIEYYNDHHTQADVLALFDRAIALEIEGMAVEAAQRSQLALKRANKRINRTLLLHGTTTVTPAPSADLHKDDLVLV